MSNSIGFKNVFYDFKTQKIHHTFIDENGKTKKEEIPIQPEYFVYDDLAETKWKDIYGRKVIPQTSRTYFDMKDFINSGMPTCEARVGQDVKFLQKRYSGEDIIPDISNFNIAIIDIETASDGSFPDVATANHPINLISIWLSKTNEVYTFGTQEYTGEKNLTKSYRWFAEEKTMLEMFLKVFRKFKVDIISGWYIKNFDIPYIIHRAKALGIDITMSPHDKYEEKNTQDGYHTDGGGYTIAGLATLDYIDLYKNFTYEKKESYQLNSICMAEIGQGKVEFEGTLNDLWKTDWNKFVEYNIQDVLLVKKLDDKRKLFELAAYMSYLCLVPIEKVFSSVSLISGLIMKYCHEKHIVIPDTKKVEPEPFDGGYVFANEGYWKWCMNFDVQSLYPTIIRMFNISPETIVYSDVKLEDHISTPISNIFYKKEQGIFPEIIDSIFKDRLTFIDMFSVKQSIEDSLSDDEISKRYKLSIIQIQKIKDQLEKDNQPSSYYRQQEQVRKIFMNSTYGVLGSPYFILYNINTAKTITACGQDIIKYLTNKTDAYLIKNWEVLAPRLFPEYNLNDKKIVPLKKSMITNIDTDSGHFCFDEMIKSIGIIFKSNDEFLWFCHTIDVRFFKPYFKKILDKYAEEHNTPQLINFQREKIITKKLILAKKKYADEIIDKKGKRFDPPKLTITGIEIVRTDTPKYCRDKLQFVLYKIFNSENKDEVDICIRNIKKDFMTQNPESMAKPKGLKDYKKYSCDLNALPIYAKKIPIQNRAAINYNHLVTKLDLPLKLIDDKDKVKLLYVHDNNELHQNCIAFLGKYPEEFKNIFSIDFEKQWQIVFEDIVNRFYVSMGWGNFTGIEYGSFDDL